jgi:predicted RNA-binding Zn ribbon-like protein
MTLNLNTDKFKLVGGDVSLDFANTAGGRLSNPQKKNGRDYSDAFYADRLQNYADLLAWSLKAGLLKENEASKLLRLSRAEPPAAEIVLERAVKLRESIYRVFKSSIEGWRPEPEDLQMLNDELSLARGAQKLVFVDNDFVFDWMSRADALDSMLWQISEAAAALLVNGDLSRVEKCGNEVCNWLFLDTSRNHTRQWCDMKDCGNLAKVRRFRAKRRNA